MKHIDLFSGIGGFSLAVDAVFDDVEHIFVEIDPFCQQVLKKHWPEATIYGDIKTFTNSECKRLERCSSQSELQEPAASTRCVELLTGGFPCQPFSAAGRRQGTDDNRYLWPEMFRIITEFSPQWVIAENVYGLVTWNEGMVLEQVCTDLESEGYEVQPFIIPAVSVNAPHRRDRVWIIANRASGRQWSSITERSVGGQSEEKIGSCNRDVAYTIRTRPPHWISRQEQEEGSRERRDSNQKSDWGKDWIKVATELCGVDDGLPVELDGFKLTKAGHRKERLKALGNAIVPQVAIQILQTIKKADL